MDSLTDAGQLVSDVGEVRPGALRRGRLLDVRVRRQPVEHGVDPHFCHSRARRVAEHHWQEVVGTQRLQPEIADGSHSGPSAGAPEQGDLSEAFPPEEGGHDPSIPNHLGLARLDHVIAVTDLALREDGLTC
jgi:hypothetical protein